jgi:hypothetical protein
MRFRALSQLRFKPRFRLDFQPRFGHVSGRFSGRVSGRPQDPAGIGSGGSSILEGLLAVHEDSMYTLCTLHKSPCSTGQVVFHGW